MASKNENLIKVKTESGIKLTIDKRVKEDTRLLFYLSRIQDKNLTQLEQNEILFSLLRLIFGSDQNVGVFMNEVAAHHEGVADPKNLLKEITEIFDALKVKN